MAKLIVTEFVSLDDVIESPGPDGSGFKYEGWTIPYANEEFQKFKFDELMAADAQLLGRVTYEGFAVAWPDRKDDKFSDKMNAMPKYVVSSTLQDLTWNNSHLLANDLASEVSRIKKEFTGDILVAGSAKLVQALTEAKLVDEYRLLVYPVVLGEGKKLFEDVHADLTLTEARPFQTGVVLLRYVPKS